jgi:hypothetical protein
MTKRTIMPHGQNLIQSQKARAKDRGRADAAINASMTKKRCCVVPPLTSFTVLLLICPSCQLAAGPFACDVGQITGISSPRPALSTRGACDRHERWVRAAMDAEVRETNASRRTAKSCGPDTPMPVVTTLVCFSFCALGCGCGFRIRFSLRPCVEKICQNVQTGGLAEPPVAGTEPVAPEGHSLQ